MPNNVWLDHSRRIRLVNVFSRVIDPTVHDIEFQLSRSLVNCGRLCHYDNWVCGRDTLATDGNTLHHTRMIVFCHAACVQCHTQRSTLPRTALKLLSTK